MIKDYQNGVKDHDQLIKDYQNEVKDQRIGSKTKKSKLFLKDI